MQWTQCIVPNALEKLRKHRWMSGWMDESIDQSIDQSIDRSMGGCIHGRIDGWTDGKRTLLPVVICHFLFVPLPTVLFVHLTNLRIVEPKGNCYLSGVLQ